MRAQLQFIKQELRRRLHDSILETGEWLRRVLQGCLNYFVVSGNLNQANSLKRTHFKSP